MAPLWKYHAVHHSSEVVDWSSAARFHRVNLSLGTVLIDVVLLLSGIPPLVLSVLVPLNVLMSVFVHANLNWSLGPFKYVIASAVFHRWHHTGPDQGGNKNFASTFAFIDLMFGTFYMPENELPSRYPIPPGLWRSATAPVQGASDQTGADNGRCSKSFPPTSKRIADGHDATRDHH